MVVSTTPVTTLNLAHEAMKTKVLWFSGTPSRTLISTWIWAIQSCYPENNWSQLITKPNQTQVGGYPLYLSRFTSLVSPYSLFLFIYFCKSFSSTFPLFFIKHIYFISLCAFLYHISKESVTDNLYLLELKSKEALPHKWGLFLCQNTKSQTSLRWWICSVSFYSYINLFQWEREDFIGSWCLYEHFLSPTKEESKKQMCYSATWLI